MPILRTLIKSAIFLVPGLAGLLGIAAVLLVFHFWLFMNLPARPGREPHQVIVRQGMNAASIAQFFHKEGIVRDDPSFRFLCWYRKAGHKLRSGEYRFYPQHTPGQVLDKLVQGKGIVHRITFPEGSDVHDVARLLAKAGLASEESIIRIAGQNTLLKESGIDAPGLEGYLFPETYCFEKTQDEASMLKAMIHQFLLHFPPAWKLRCEELHMSVHQVVILASIVEKEAGIDSERPLIAAVFANRLKQNMPLQSDPTAVYDLPGFSGRVMKFHLERQSPYNTYRISGLPPGPICNPGAKSLQAVLYPEQVPYLYFVSNNDGSHQFSSTLAEHQAAVERYREKREAERKLEAGEPRK